MVEILKRGILPEEVTRVTTCNRCHSTLRYMIGEVKKVDHGHNSYRYEFPCPVEGCGGMAWDVIGGTSD